MSENIQQCDRLHTSTSTAGRDVLKRDARQMQADLSDLAVHADEVKCELERALEQWQAWEECVDNTTRWLDRAEQQVKDVALMSTLEEKEDTLTKIKVIKS